MKRFIVTDLPIDKTIELSDEEARHARDVLRSPSGQIVELLNGQGQAVLAELHFSPSKKKGVLAKALHPLQKRHESPGETIPVHLAAAVIKGEAMHWLLEKCVELGVQSFTPLLSERVVPNLKHKGPESFRLRWQKISDQALKQCGRLRRMEVHSVQPLDHWSLASHPHLLLTEPELETNGRSLVEVCHTDLPECTLITGPEGGWSSKDLEQMINNSTQQWLQYIDMGPVTLKAETAAIAAVSVLASHFRSKHPSNQLKT